MKRHSNPIQCLENMGYLLPRSPLACTTGLPQRASWPPGASREPCTSGCMWRASWLRVLQCVCVCDTLTQTDRHLAASRPNASHSYQTPMAALCDARRRWAVSGGCAWGVTPCKHAHFPVPTPPRWSHSVTATLKTSAESLGTRLARFCRGNFGTGGLTGPNLSDGGLL